MGLSFSHLNEHKSCHNFRDTVNPLWLCSTETETASHYLLLYPFLSEQRTKLLENHRNLDNTLLSHCYDDLVNILLYGSSKFSFCTNNKIMSLTAKFFRIYETFWQTALLNSVYFPWTHYVVTALIRRLFVVCNIMWRSYWHWDNVECSIGCSL